jgi:hypothetical protein
MTGVSLGRLQSIPLRTVWLSESNSFTPWLASDENLSLLAEAIGIDLELEAQEKAVGPFRADILCKDVGTDSWVLIENQLERTDHTHLGQILTYAAGLDAVTIVWIAARFTEEHRATLDWLNKITEERFRFFGVEVELWSIGNSVPAPKFNIVAKPNDWSRSVAQAARAIDDAELSDTRAMQVRYWTGLHAVMGELNGPLAGNRRAQPQSWMAYSIGRSGFHLAAAMNGRRKKIRAELYLSGANAKNAFSQLESRKIEIENEIGFSLQWEDLPGRRDCRVCVYYENVDPEDASTWPSQHAWLAEKLNQLHRVFYNRIRTLGTSVEPGEIGDLQN